MPNLWDESDFESYAEFCRGRDYCSPWHPFVGSSYGTANRLKFLYCGGSAWWSEQQQECSVFAAKALTDQFVAEGMYSTPFWRLFERAAKLVYPDIADKRGASALSAWTNLSKTGVVGASAPPDSDVKLRELDVAQLKRELAILNPDILMCVSGSLVPSVGHAVFDFYADAKVHVNTPSTWIRRTPWGGWLIWTMHPAYKSADWYRSVESDLSTVLRSLNDPILS